jgi:transcriptional regulator
MYVPKHFAQDDPELLLEVMRTYNFATLIGTSSDGPYATHLPVLASRLESGTFAIDAHVAHANPQWRFLETDPRVLVIFEGPHAYISPKSYRSNRRVPTWNYIAVHARGRARVFHGAEEKLATLDKLIRFHEPSFAPRFAEFESGMRDSLVGAIVGMEIAVEKIEGKFKLNQHRLADDRSELEAEYRQGDENHRALAQWMERLGYWGPKG